MEVMRLCLRERSGQPGCAELSALCGVIGDMTSLQHGSRVEDWLEFLILCYLLKDTEKLCQVTIQLSEAQGNDVMTKYAYDLNNRAVSDKQALISSIMRSQRDKSELVRRRNAQEQTQGQLSYEASAWPEQAQPPLWEEKGRWLGLGRLDRLPGTCNSRMVTWSHFQIMRG